MVVSAARFRGRDTDRFDVDGRGLAVRLTQIAGAPRAGVVVHVGDLICKIFEIGRNATDGQVVSARDCLAGRSAAPYGAVAWDAPVGVVPPGAWVKEVGGGWPR